MTTEDQPNSPEATDTGVSQFDTNAEHAVDPPADEDPRTTTLRGMFPDFDIAVITSVLESVSWDTDRAIDVLLSMSDPDYVSTHGPPQPQTQAELDEQFARRLVLEEMQQMDANAAVRYEQQQDSQRQAPPPQESGGSQGLGTTTNLQDQFYKISDQGKKTFGAFITKVKAAMREFEHAGPSQTTPPPAQAAPVQPIRPDVDTTYPTYTRHSTSRETQASPRPSTQPPTGYDVSPTTTPVPETQASVPPSQPSPTQPIDGGKLGILPKRPVSLLWDQEPPHHDDDDDLEYVDNPFEQPDGGIKPSTIPKNDAT